ncbi:hypothetical protein EMIHUDRAFT_204744 [Emiliania huxleyi CCMP1516]|uniref:Ku domain-containing protein n=2 Tax=Emiliania huxleyi TaxID=2903 RepID=A0A0D3JW96_EMIH1|nr:hypothetical protein EMIHUDRAFT_204744 [Emiliania huxleyi CCMP1516]EOD27781.1 hypothetical protein EMIHUDRAFT_204744 [Emiliania huxleyi CCMP1516]|eukprot:XP_005780210.1 hypothetical protein EMIHUDRAFT_204744 [Emiliania huxleyi CCMP1516]
MASKEALFIALDVSDSMRPHLDDVTGAVQRMLCDRIFHSKQDAVGLLKAGADATDNEVALQMGGYDHIAVVGSMGPVGMKRIENVGAIHAESGRADLIDAVVVAADAIARYVRKNKWSKRVLLVSDGATSRAELDEEQVADIASQLADNHIVLETWAALARLGARLDALGKPDKPKPFVAREWSEAKRVWSEPRAKATKSTAAYRGPLALGGSGGGFLPVRVWRKVAASNSAPVLFKSWVLKSDLDTQVRPNEMVAAYRYGRDVIPVAGALEENMRYGVPEKCLELHGFVPRASVPRHYLLGPSEVLVGDDAVAGADKAVQALCYVLDEERLLGIARYARSKGLAPRLAVLWPSASGCLHLNILPFSDEARISELEPQARALLRRPKDVLNPQHARLQQIVVHRALHKSEALPPPPPRLMVSTGESAVLLDAMAQMRSCLLSLFDKAGRPDDPAARKGFDCLRALRSACIKEDEPDKYNELLKSVKAQWLGESGDAAPSREPFWRVLCEDSALSAGLISSSENDDSSVSAAEARAFLRESSAPAPAAAPAAAASKPADGEEEDDYDDLE